MKLPHTIKLWVRAITAIFCLERQKDIRSIPQPLSFWEYYWALLGGSSE